MADTYSVDAAGIRQSTQLSPTGTGFVDTWIVPYTITSGPAAGVMGTVVIPAQQYNADYVAATIQAAVDAHTAVASI